MESDPDIPDSIRTDLCLALDNARSLQNGHAGDPLLHGHTIGQIASVMAWNVGENNRQFRAINEKLDKLVARQERITVSRRLVRRVWRVIAAVIAFLTHKP